MKKWLLALLLMVVLFIAGVYILIPSHLTISKIELIKCNPAAATRVLNDPGKWARWWPDSNVTHAAKGYVYKGFSYTISSNYTSGPDITTQSKELNTGGSIVILPLGTDSAALEWKTELVTTSNPVRKIMLYRDAEKIKANMIEILAKAKSFLEKQENVYDVRIEKGKVKDTVLMATKSVTANYPSVNDIYEMVHLLKDYINKQGSTETAPPMLHVKTIDSSHFETMVAIPVNRWLPENKMIVIKRMVSGNILIAEVKGGPYAIKKAFQQLTNYVNDYGRQSPAIPFESLVTDRSLEADTTKWITRVYFPVY